MSGMSPGMLRMDTSPSVTFGTSVVAAPSPVTHSVHTPSVTSGTSVVAAPSPVTHSVHTKTLCAVKAMDPTMSSTLRVTASEFTPITIVPVTTYSSSGDVSIPMPAHVRMPLSTGMSLTAVTATRTLIPPMLPSLVSSANIIPIVSTSTVSTPRTTLLPMGSVPVTHAFPVAGQLPPICKFRGEDPEQEGSNFEEWVEQFELIADAYSWDSKTQLVNLITRLQGQAYSFYRTCSPEQKFA